MNEIKKVVNSKANVIKLLSVSETAPINCIQGDMYYNTSTNLIYISNATNTWSEEGKEPIEGYLYVDLEKAKMYYYDGTFFANYGGTSNEIVISPDQPTTEDWKIWINPDEPINNIGTEVVDTLDGNETDKAPSVRTVKEELDNKINEIPKIKWKQYTTPSSDSGVITGYDGTSNIIGFQVYAFEQWRSGTEAGTLAKTNDKLFYLNATSQASNYFNKPIKIFYI